MKTKYWKSCTIQENITEMGCGDEKWSFVKQKMLEKILPLAVEHHKFLYVNPLEHKHQCMAKWKRFLEKMEKKSVKKNVYDFLKLNLFKVSTMISLWWIHV